MRRGRYRVDRCASGDKQVTLTSHPDLIAPPAEARRAVELAKRVEESFAGWPQMWNTWDVPMNWMGFPNSGPVYLRGATGTTNDRRGGRDLPLYWTEVDLRGFRVLARYLHDTNGFALGFMGRLTDYVVRKGFGWQACRKGVKKTAYPTSLTPDDPLVAKGQGILDDFRMANKWPITCREAFLRSRRDGEVYGRLFYGGWGKPARFRFVEPEQIGNPTGQTDGPESFGLRNVPGDVCSIEAFHVWDMEAGMIGGEWVPAEEIAYLKANTDSTIKRGLPDLFPVQEQLDGVRRLLRNMIDTGIDQAAISWRERFATASGDQVRAMIPTVPTSISNAMPFAGAWGPWANANGFNTSKVIRVEGSREFEDGPLAAGVPNYVMIEQACLRGVGARWGMPEYFSGDSSNNNFASSLVSGSPFALAVEGGQVVYGTWEREVALKALDLAVRAGLLTPQERTELDVEITEPAIVNAEPEKETNRRKTLHDAGVLSTQTWQLQEQLDPAHEAENIKAHREAFPPVEQQQVELKKAEVGANQEPAVPTSSSAPA